MKHIGVVHGRFQLLHNDHMKYILAAREKCDHLIVGICNPDPRLSKFSSIDPHRTAEVDNPFTYYERQQMIKLALIEQKVTAYDIVPFPISYPESIFYYTPKDAEYFLTIYDKWGESKKDELESIGCQVTVLWKKELTQKAISGTRIRRKIANGEDWLEYVPRSVYEYIVRERLDQRIIELGIGK